MWVCLFVRVCAMILSCIPSSSASVATNLVGFAGVHLRSLEPTKTLLCTSTQSKNIYKCLLGNIGRGTVIIEQLSTCFTVSFNVLAGKAIYECNQSTLQSMHLRLRLSVAFLLAIRVAMVFVSVRILCNVSLPIFQLPSLMLLKSSRAFLPSIPLHQAEIPTKLRPTMVQDKAQALMLNMHSDFDFVCRPSTSPCLPSGRRVRRCSSALSVRSACRA